MKKNIFTLQIVLCLFICIGMNKTIMAQPGNSLTFNGSNNYVNCGNNASLQITGSITVEAWIKATAWRTNYWEGSIIEKEDVTNMGGYGIRCGNSGQLSFYFGNASTWIEILSPVNAMVTGYWFHVCGTYDGVTMKMYINGNLAASQAQTGAIGASTNNMIIGSAYDYLTARVFNGAIDEVRIFNTARSASQVLTDMNNVLNPGSEPNLVAYYNFDQSSGTTLPDLKGSNTGTLVSSPTWGESYAMVVPVPQAATNITTASFTANWTAPVVGIVNNYYLDVSTASNFSSFVGSYHNYDCGTNLSQSVSGLTSNNTYYYRVRASKTSVANQGYFYYSSPSALTLGNIEVTATAGTLGPTAYSTLKAAFDAINAGTHQSAITITVNGSTTETAAAVLNASGSGSASYSSINIYPTVTGLSISGNLATPLIDLNGADNVTIDGRVNATGSTVDLTITNTSTSVTAGTSTIRFINDATYNTIKYCLLKGSTLNTTAGVLFFSTTNLTSVGNSYNKITNNNITCSVDANRPLAIIYSSGTTVYLNVNDTISNNNIYNFLNRGSNAYGIYIYTNTSVWTVSGNSFYETASFVPISSSAGYEIIYLGSGVNYTISNNYIGGSAPACGGTAWTKTNAYTNSFYGIMLNVGTSTASNIQGNIIQNFSWANSGNSSWNGVYIAAGNLNIGTTSGNTIGAATGNGSIILTNGAAGGAFYGIYTASSGTIDCENNTIGAITVGNSYAANSTHFYGFENDGSGTVIVANNVFGSTDAGTTNSINATSPSTGTYQSVYGIMLTAGTLTISGNTVSKLSNQGSANYQHTSIGVYVNGGTNTISNNTIRDLTCASPNTNALNGASCIGIAMAAATTAQTITGNTIYNLSNTYASPAGVYVMGIYYSGSTTASSVKNNFIHNLSVNSGNNLANIYGINISTGATTYSNNIISIAGNTTSTIYGIYERGAASNNNNLYFNTVYIGGSPTSGSRNSYALYSAVTTNTRNFRNNIFMNARSNNGATGKHYAAYFNYAVSTNLTLDYNDYYAPGTGGVLGYYNSANVTTLPLIATKDANSLAIDPLFANADGTTAVDYFLSASLPAVTGTGITTDYSGTTRNVTTPRMGAWDVNSVLPIKLISFSGYATGNVNQLNWITVNEINNNYFELQRSADGMSFSSLGIIKSKGNSYSNQNYNYTDAMPLSGKNYYRLKQVDIDGSFTYSSIIMIANNSTGSRIIVYPNPTSGQIIISTAKSLTNASIRLLDISGRMILQQSNVSGNSFNLNITNQPAGIYFIEMNDASLKERFKILKQ